MVQVPGWGPEAVFCPSKVPTPKENGEKKKDEPSVMAVDPEPNSEVTAETKFDEIDGGGGGDDLFHDR